MIRSVFSTAVSAMRPRSPYYSDDLWMAKIADFHAVDCLTLAQEFQRRGYMGGLYLGIRLTVRGLRGM